MRHGRAFPQSTTRTSRPLWYLDVEPPAASGQLYVKIAGVFVHKPTKIKVAGSFVAATAKVKVGGVFQDAV